ncbi:hypothetical protein K432DRAFT_320527 [Lepidopterella palustris CBS 459.81]|uniref:Uncharacterized protein n=1 Tax=Lepidopterella palustris CBS 459.81 TaxID=1314670 RepID=A0A8E2JJ22_9PEZI|nr:hypothetical protein K432DRAFT_320527 [Lepidopterella palustris CBS 459.81]
MDGENSKGKRKRSRFPAPLDELDEERRERSRQRYQDLMKHYEDHPLPKLTDEDRIDLAKSALRNHIGIGGERHPRIAVLFFIELTPHSASRGAACQHVTCDDRIEEDSYRIAVHPGMNVYQSPDFYHVRCFEDLVDFSQGAYLDRIVPVTRYNARMRGLKGRSISYGNYLLDGGAERLILEWKSSMGKLIDRRDGVPIEPMEPDLNDLLRKSGSASYQSKIIDGMSRHEFFNLSTNLAPIESDGAEDQEEWNLFERYLSMTFDDIEDLNEPHSLSDMLSEWKTDKFLACANEDKLNDKGKDEKEKLGEKAIRAIRRLSSIPMPDFQSALLG